jgi:hypothetical protein
MRVHCHRERGVGGVCRDMPVQSKFMACDARRGIWTQTVQAWVITFSGSGSYTWSKSWSTVCVNCAKVATGRH